MDAQLVIVTGVVVKTVDVVKLLVGTGVGCPGDDGPLVTGTEDDATVLEGVTGATPEGEEEGGKELV